MWLDAWLSIVVDGQVRLGMVRAAVTLASSGTAGEVISLGTVVAVRWPLARRSQEGSAGPASLRACSLGRSTTSA